MKPILFNTDMVRAILAGRKTVTRRVVKPQPPATAHVERYRDSWHWSFWEASCGHRMKQPYRPGDILYVRETWCKCCLKENYGKGHSDYCYKASIESPVYGCIDCYTEKDGCKWRPSIHMPKEAARLFLRVTAVRVERLQDITDEQARAEGADGWMVATDRDWDRNPNFILSFRYIWEHTLKSADRDLYGWEANPWVFVIEFCKISKEEAEKEKSVDKQAEK